MSYTIGIDYGSDSARAVLVDAADGKILSASTFNYPRWAEGRWCDPSKNQFRQNPLDYLEALEHVLGEVVAACPDRKEIKAISVDSTGSTPCFTDAEGRPLCLYHEFANDPDAMFILWKDHTGALEAEEITAAAAPAGYASQSGNHYSSECTWAKVLHVHRTNPRISEAAGGIIEEADYITNVLTGCRDFSKMKISHCIPAAKQMYKEEWGGFPPDSFFASIDPALPKLRHLTPDRNYYSDEAAGNISPEWATKLGLEESVVIGVGNCDAHSGAVGGGIEEGKAVLNIGTSACYMAIARNPELIPGVFGEADGSIVRGYYGLEAGLSAFGDIFAWMKRLLCWGREDDPALLAKLNEEAQALPLREDAPLATDHFNGRRCPDPNNFITAAISGLRITTGAPEVYRALVEAAAFASRAAIELYTGHGVRVDRMVAIGGIPNKSPFVMQTLADVLGKPVEVSACKDSCALGAAIHAAVAVGLYKDVFEAEKAMAPGSAACYVPDESRREYYERRFARYKALASFCE